MNKRHATLLAQIEDDVVNGSPVADTLRKAVVLGGKAGSTALREWATKELKGYGPDDELPEYRIVGAPICVDALVGNGWVKGQRMSVYELPKFAQESVSEELKLTFPVRQLEALILNPPGRGVVDRVVTAEMPCWWAVWGLRSLRTTDQEGHLRDATVPYPSRAVCGAR